MDFSKLSHTAYTCSAPAGNVARSAVNSSTRDKTGGAPGHGHQFSARASQTAHLGYGRLRLSLLARHQAAKTHLV